MQEHGSTSETPMRPMKGAPVHCDLCPAVIPVGEVVVDGKTKQGPWGYMCQVCFPIHGVGLGTGKGQQFRVEA